MFRALVLLAVFAASPALAQLITGSIAGSVKDPAGLAISGAEVTVRQDATGRVRNATTNAQGDFIVTGLDSGDYTLRVSRAGFKVAERQSIHLVPGDRLTVGDLPLELGAVSETVSVAGNTVAVQTSSAERSETITPTQVQNLLVRGRNVMDLMQLVPGVVVRSQPEDLSSASNFNVLGNRSTTNNITIDGIPAADMGNGSQLKLTVSQDAVAEVKILVSNYQAEYGRMSGSNVVVVTKSGTRDFHGLASYFKRHEQFNANDFFSNRNSLAKQRYRYNTFTYNLGGPVFVPGRFNRNREKLFFNWGQEFWPTQGARSGFLTVPTALEKAGNYSQTLDVSGRLIAIRDPSTNNVFPGNAIPASRLDPSGTALLKVQPDPNFTDRNISRGNYNWVFNTPYDTPKYTHSLKLDYNVSPADTITFSFNRFKEEQIGSIGVASSGGLNWPQMTKTWSSRPSGYIGRWTRIVRPNIVNEFNFGWLNQPADDFYSESELQRVLRTAVGYRAPELNAKGNPQGIIPNATFGGVPSPAQLTVEGRFPLINRYHIFNFADSLSWTTGGHTIKAGFYIEYFRRYQKKAVPFNGAIDFGRNVNNPLDTNWAYSNASLGIYNSYTQSSDFAPMNVRSTGVEWFIQDNWRLTRRLTLDYGLRFYIVPPLYERDDQLAGFVPSAYDAAKRPQLIAPGLANGVRVGVHPVTGATYPATLIGAIAPGVGDPNTGMVVDASDRSLPRGLMKNRGVQYGPRFGLAYDVTGDGKTALRAGGGLFYNRFFSEVFFTPLLGQQPLIQTPVVNFGRLAELGAANGLLYPSNVFSADPSGMLPTTYNFSVSLQRDLGRRIVADIGYAGSLGRHLYWRRDINPIALGANFQPANFDPTLAGGRPLPPSFLRPYQGYNNINIMEGAGSSNYHGLLASLKRRFTKGLEFGLAYTWSKALDYNDSDTDTITPLVDRRVWHYGLADFDRTHVMTINYVWELPRWKAAPVVAKTIVNDWQVSGITQFVSGQPLGIGFSTVNAIDITGTASQGARVVVLSDPVLPKSERTFSRNFRPDVFRQPAVGTIGNAAKTLIRGPGINNTDIALFKSFPIHEQMRLQFRWELYNAFNHTQFAGLDTTARFDPAGAQVNARFGEFTSARNPRQMQFALRFFF